MEKIDWVRGDSLGLDIPAHSLALLEGGVDFLTRAFRASGSLAEDNSVARIAESQVILGGSTGSKLLLSVEYEKPLPGLHTNLFVKFSRNFDDKIKDAGRVQMELEVLFALLSRDPDFPIAVPVCYFSDFHHASGTGILITQRIPFGIDGVEPEYVKALDYKMPDQLGHYQALIRSLGRLAGSHRAGRLPDAVEQYFPFDQSKLRVSDRDPYTPEQIGRRAERYIEFIKSCPRLFPDNLRSERFFARLIDEAPRFQAIEQKAQALLESCPDMIALCHWNAHVDNAWFWRGEDGQLDCGLMDWGNVSQMNVAMALWGCLSAAELPIWDEHLDDLIELFISEFEQSGGPVLDPKIMRLHLTAYICRVCLAWMLDTPKTMLMYSPDLADAKDRFDPLVEDHERVRSQLLIGTVFLNLWEKTDMNQLINFLENDISLPQL